MGRIGGKQALTGPSARQSIERRVDLGHRGTRVINLAGCTVQDGTPLYWTQPGRSAFVTISTSF